MLRTIRFAVVACMTGFIGVGAFTLRLYGQDSDAAESQRNVDAAAAFAREFGPEGSAPFTIAFRNALEAAYAIPFTVPGQGGRKSLRSAGAQGGLDQDERYRNNLVAMLQDTSSQKIWGGARTPPGTYPDTVAVLGNGGLCSGTLIAPNVVLTASHCFCDGVKDTVVVGESLDSTTTVRVTRSVSRLTCPLDGSAIRSGDIALMFLDRNLPGPTRRLAESAWIDEARSIRAVGFGLTEDPAREPIGIKRQVDVPIASTNCNGRVSLASGPVPDSTYYGCGPQLELVAGQPRLDRDSCGGDSGGPAFIRRPDGQDYLAAATSRAVVRPGARLRDCGDGGIYARVDGQTLDWIRKNGVNVQVGAVAGRGTTGPAKPSVATNLPPAPVTGWPLGLAFASWLVTPASVAPGFAANEAAGQAQLPAQTREVVGVFRRRPDGVIVFREDATPDRWSVVSNGEAVPQTSFELPLVVKVRSEGDAVRVFSPFVLEAVSSWRALRPRLPRARFEKLHDAFGALETSASEKLRPGAMSGDSAPLVGEIGTTEDEIVEAYAQLGSTEDELRKALARQFRKVLRSKKAQYLRDDQYPPAAYEQIFLNSRGAAALAFNDETGSFCSGVLISKDLVLTARHCFTTLLPGDYTRLEVRFGYERNLLGKELNFDRYAIDRIVAQGFDVTSNGPKLDFALLRVAPNAENEKPGDRHPPQCLSKRQVRRDEPVYVIGHPRGDFRTVHDNAFVYFPFQVNRFDFTRLKIMVDAELADDPGRPKELARFERSYQRRLDNGNELFEHFSERWGRQPTIGADSDTYHGNSGSPVYSRRNHLVVGIFTEGEPDVASTFEPGWRRHEASIPITAIKDQLDRLMPEWRKEPGVCDGGAR